jgi:HPt (histidine-containing phosphotransfer) domain-containing protein
MELHTIDRAALDNLLETTGGDPAFLAELIDTYLTDSVGLLETMGQAVSGADAEQLRRAAHSLKSNSASFGAHGLAELCQEVEHRARSGLLDEAAPRLAQVKMSFAKVERELRLVRGEL